MSSESNTSSAGKIMFWAGWIITILPALMLIFSATLKLMKSDEVIQGMPKMGWPETLAFSLGAVELVCTIIYLIPQTAVLGAILLTGYLGGAIATHVRVGDQFIFPAAFGVLVWLGLYLRDGRIRALLPLRS